ncbi:SBBP repeat-containing protein [Paraflavisolibacter sp. H34]|uniref:SBBP repeat-containing protein n=1 Tax=Huijunlia imazamoxiresistens TaxID=3127457 RepID=UPI003015BAA7
MKKSKLLGKRWLLAALFLLPALGFAQASREWVKRYNFTSQLSSDRAASIATDASGNVYVTGESAGDYTTIKYGPDGSKKWTALYNGPESGGDRALGVAVDGSGNVYVTGTSDGGSSDQDYATVKYNSSGVQQWVARYNGTANGDDRAWAIALDGAGNVYVTGQSEGSVNQMDQHYDYATVKYNSSGVQQWVARYNSAEGVTDRAIDVAVDGSGSVYVTGTTMPGTEGNEYDIVTIKYNSSGAQLWTTTYNATNYDTAIELALGPSGSVYVAGRTGDDDDDESFTLIKYNASGVQQWVSLYQSGTYSHYLNGLAVDAAGNAWVTGATLNASDENPDYTTVKYNAAGVQQWAKRFNGTGNDHDEAMDIAVDGLGNAYVTGKSTGTGTNLDYITLKYSATGTQLWAKRHNGTAGGEDVGVALALDKSANVQVTGYSLGTGTREDYYTIKFNKDGAQQWAVRHNGLLNGDDRAYALGVDGSGNVLVTGQGLNSAGNLDFITLKLDGSGSFKWSKAYNGPGNGDDVATALAVDGSGNVYVAGRSPAGETDLDYAVIKYDTYGAVKWTKRYNSGFGDDEPLALAVDATGNVYVTGRSKGNGTGYDYATLKYNSSGTQLWAARYAGPAGDDAAYDLAVDGSGNVYVTGEITVDLQAEEFDWTDMATIKYNAAGVPQWVKTYHSDDIDHASDLTLDVWGNVYITGWSGSDDDQDNYTTIKYSTGGVQQWVAIYNSGFDRAMAIALDGSGNVVVTGFSTAAIGFNQDYATVKYNTSGAQQWVKRYTGLGNNDWATALAVDGSGNVYVTGRSGAGGNNDDYATIKYDKNGVQLWADRFNGTGGGDDVPAALVVDKYGKAYVTGTSLGLGTANDYLTIKYGAAPAAITGVDNREIYSPRFRLSHMPNPVSTFARIVYELPASGQLALKLYDAQGREVATLANETAKAGLYTRQLDASGLQKGVYFYRLRLQAGTREWVQTGQMTVVR